MRTDEKEANENPLSKIRDLLKQLGLHVHFTGTSFESCAPDAKIKSRYMHISMENIQTVNISDLGGKQHLEIIWRTDK
jgi:hypothetical protein